MIGVLKNILPYSIASIFLWCVKDNIFFWDTIQLASRHGNWFYEQWFMKQHFTFQLPENLDSGHPPFFGIYIALAWKYFGKTLITSHLCMTPFVFGIIFYSLRIGALLGGQKNAWWLCALIFANPFILTQCSLVSPDVVLICAFLMAIYGIFEDKYELKTTFSQVSKTIGLLLLAMISMRGCMLLAALCVFDLFSTYYFNSLKIHVRYYLKFILPYLPALTMGLGFLVFHYQATGWIGYHEYSPWAPAFEKVDFMGFLKNIGIFIFRLMSYGNFILWSIIIYGLVLLPRILKAQGPGAIGAHPGIQLLHLLGLLSIVCVFLLPSMLIHKGLLQHRYLIPIELIASFLTFYILINNSFLNSKKRIFSMVVCILISGHFMLFPKNMAQGWDCTMTHYPYFELQKEAMNRIETAHIPLKNIASSFPNNHNMQYIDLSENEQIFAEYSNNETEYILYSNIYNQFNINVLNKINQSYSQRWRIEKGAVEIVLFQKK